jgi:hypothetical protein
MFDLNKSKTIGYHLPMSIYRQDEDHEKISSNDITSNALINEYKGNLFEYLVGHEVAKLAKVESSFLGSFGGEAKERLSFYQQELYKLDRGLYQQLPRHAHKVAKELVDYLIETGKPSNISNIVVMGKSAAGGQDSSFGECDLMLLTPQTKLPISLKFCKRKAYVNTKSGGLRSFVDKYFAGFGDLASARQAQLNKTLDISFEQVARELYEVNGLNLQEDDKPFGTLWTGPDLPGQLSSSEKKILLAHYYRMIEKLFECFKELYAKDKNIFLHGLASMVGLTMEEMIQAVCFHSEDQSLDVRFYEWKNFVTDKKSFELIELKEQVSSFEMKIGNRLLQIRVKPMNKFTVSAMKVNCGVKFL